MSGLAAGAAVIFLYYALQRADVVVVSPLVATSPLITLLLAHLFLSRLEKITREVAVGTTLTVLGIIVVVLGSTM
jgi:uncharacterized membrane protein